MTFDEFYSAYPRHEGRKAAERAWHRLGLWARPMTTEDIKDALEWQIPVFRKREKKFIPLPATWLNGERWNDEPPKQPAPQEVQGEGSGVPKRRPCSRCGQDRPPYTIKGHICHVCRTEYPHGITQPPRSASARPDPFREAQEGIPRGDHGAHPEEDGDPQ